MPIKDYSGKTIAAVSVSGPTFRMTDEYIESKLNYLFNTAIQSSTQLGYEKPN
jgi:DNA-binding IclR family transcriptional regulator